MAGKDSTIIRTTVQRDVYEKADMRAKDRGTNLSALLRDLLERWLIETEPVDPEIKPDQATWLRLTKWLEVNEFVRPDGIKTKGQMMQWAKSRGFKG